MTLRPLFHPRSVCLVGVSGDPRRLAGRPVERLAQHRFPGKVYLVNPKYQELSGYPCFPSVDRIGEPVDVALVTLPAHLVPDAVRDCGGAGIRNVVVVSSGFEEDSSAPGLGTALREAVRDSGVRLVGPNCEGLWSVPARLALTFGSAAARDSMVEGSVSVISQSGSIGGASMRRLQDAGIGCRYFVSTGNETDLTTMDFLDHMVAEGGSDVIAMFVEALSDGRRLREIADRARRRGVRLVALRAGDSPLGREATMSHTGRIATAAHVYRSLFQQAGVLEVDTLTDLLDAIRLATRLTRPGPARPAGPGGAGGSAGQDAASGTGPAPGRGAGVIAISGGSRALIADACQRRAVPLATFSTGTRALLDDLLPRFGYGRNPADVTGAVLDDPALFSRVLEVVAADEATDAVLVQYANGAGPQVRKHLTLYRSLVAGRRLPVVMSFLGTPEPEVTEAGDTPDLVTATDPDAAVKYLSWYYHFRRQAAYAPPDPGSGQWPDPGRRVSAPAGTRSAARPALGTWHERMDFLAGAGIPCARWAVCRAGEPVGEAGLAYPLVVKALPETVEHKTERGLVRLGVRDQAERDEAIRLVRERAGSATPVLVQEMVPDSFEALLAVRDDPDFGPVLAIGSGGVLAEWANDVTYLQAPVGDAEVAAALRGLRSWPLLQGYRGSPARDVDALVGAAVRLGAAYLGQGLAGWEVELNPLMVRQRGHGVVAVDALCARSRPGEGG